MTEQDFHSDFMINPEEYTDIEGRVFRYEQGQRVYLDGGKDTGANVVVAKKQPTEKAATIKKRKTTKPSTPEIAGLAFKSSRNFCDDIAVRCLSAKTKNSNLLGVARRHIAEKGEDPTCFVFLRGESTSNISSWQQEMLTRLLEKDELASGIEQAMKEYANSESWAGFDKTSELFAEIQTHGIVPHITVHTIVIDEVLKKVVLNCGTEWDLNLEEHGIAITYCNNMWKFGYADEFSDYQGEVDDFERAKKWAKIYPESSAPQETQTDADPSFLYGTWVFDEAGARELLQKLRCSQSHIDDEVRGFRPYRYVISPTELRMKFHNNRYDPVAVERAMQQMISMSGMAKKLTTPKMLTQEESRQKILAWQESRKDKDGVVFDEAGYEYNLCEFLGCERRGDRVMLKFRSVKSNHVGNREFFYRDERLLDLEGLVMKRVTD